MGHWFGHPALRESWGPEGLGWARSCTKLCPSHTAPTAESSGRNGDTGEGALGLSDSSHPFLEGFNFLHVPR